MNLQSPEINEDDAFPFPFFFLSNSEVFFFLFLFFIFPVFGFFKVEINSRFLEGERKV